MLTFVGGSGATTNFFAPFFVTTFPPELPGKAWSFPICPRLVSPRLCHSRFEGAALLAEQESNFEICWQSFAALEWSGCGLKRGSVSMTSEGISMTVSSVPLSEGVVSLSFLHMLNSSCPMCWVVVVVVEKLPLESEHSGQLHDGRSLGLEGWSFGLEGKSVTIPLVWLLPVLFASSAHSQISSSSAKWTWRGGVWPWGWAWPEVSWEWVWSLFDGCGGEFLSQKCTRATLQWLEWLEVVGRATLAPPPSLPRVSSLAVVAVLELDTCVVVMATADWLGHCRSDEAAFFSSGKLTEEVGTSGQTRGWLVSQCLERKWWINSELFT